jgi:hypothetical protein
MATPHAPSITQLEDDMHTRYHRTKTYASAVLVRSQLAILEAQSLAVATSKMLSRHLCEAVHIDAMRACNSVRAVLKELQELFPEPTRDAIRAASELELDATNVYESMRSLRVAINAGAINDQLVRPPPIN